MAKVIYKYPMFDGFGRMDCQIQIPKKAKILRVAYQEASDLICLWVLTDAPPGQQLESRSFVMKNTGQVFDPKGLTYLDTVSVKGGSYIGHVFEVERAGLW